MAQIRDRKGNFYSQKQAVRDELSAPQYLESAGDELIKYLTKKQTNTSTSLKEQLEIVQDFKKGFELNPDHRKGVTSLEDFKRHALNEQETSILPTKQEEIRNVNGEMITTGLSRHELELNLCEKPTSTVSQLYRFAVQNQRLREKCEEPEKRLLGHPINHLKEIEEEYFGQSGNKKHEGTSQENRIKKMKKKKRRNRKKKAKADRPDESSSKESPSKSERLVVDPIAHTEKESSKPSFSRPSLWDVKDMKKWSEGEKIGCRPQAFYTIKNGKIIKLTKECGEGEGT